MIDKILKTGKPIILSSGMSNYDELDKTFSYVKKNVQTYQFYNVLLLTQLQQVNGD